MIKYIKKLILSLIAGILIFGTLTPVFAFDYGEEVGYDLEEIHEMLISELGYEFLENYNQAMETVGELYDFFQISDSGEAYYPAYFGGLYINDEGNLVLSIVASGVPWAIPTFEYFDYITIKEVDFSFNDLSTMMNLLDEYIANSPSLDNISSWALDEEANRIIIYLVDYSAEAIDDFKSNVINSPKFIFEQGEKTIIQVDDLQSEIDELDFPDEPIVPNPKVRSFNALRPGERLRFYRPGVGWLNGTLTIGYRAYAHHLQADQRIPGFMTAAHIGVDSLRHGLRNGDIATDMNWWRIGDVHGARLRYFDAAFVRLDDPNRLLPTIHSEQGNRTYPRIFRGQLLIMNGGMSGWIRGEVVYPQTNIHVSVNNVYGNLYTFPVNNVITSTHTTQPGDSGSVVYSVTDSNNIIDGVAGIHIARWTAGNGARISRASHINTMFDHAGMPFRLR